MINPVWSASLSFLAVTAASMVGLSLATPRERITRRRIEAVAASGPTGPVPREKLLEQPFIQRVLLPALGAFSALGDRLTPSAQRDRLVQKLQQAGIFGPQGVQALLAVKALSLAIAAVVFWYAGAINVGAGLVGGATVALIGLVGPERWVNARIKKRQESMTRSLPDALDLVTSCVEAGLSFDGSVLRMTSRSSGHGRELREELGRYMTDVRVGRPRAEALQDLSRRCGVPDLEGVTAALVQADQLGVGVAQTLRTQSQHLRNKRRQRAQEQALKAPVKMLFPLVFFIFPTMFIVTLGPAVIRIIDTFSKMHH